MSCTVFAVPYALAWVVGAIGTAAISGIESYRNERLDERVSQFEDNYIDEDIHVINEQNLVEKTFETPFTDKEILLKTLEEHGVRNIEETDGKISGQTGNYTLVFSKSAEEKPYNVYIHCHQTDNAEEKVSELSSEYALNVQEEAYLSIVEKLKDNNMEIETEEVQDDNTIVLTINLE